MIEIQGLYKAYNDVNVLKDVNLEIKEGEIFGLIGKSGTGKSTLLRCINLLENFQEGKIYVDNVDVSSLRGKSVREYRKGIGMVFQHFSLLNRRTVYENIAAPLKCWGYKKEEIDKRVKELLELVNIEEKIFEKPSDLSGGQKQRVAIARALALNPEILLCDEATSALDPNTTNRILELLYEINEKLNITIVVVSHQMEVIRKLCNRVAIMNDGRIIEIGNVDDIFLNDTDSLKKFLGEEIMELPDRNINIQMIFKEGQFDYLSEIIYCMEGKIEIVASNIEKFRKKRMLKAIVNIKEENMEKFKKCIKKYDISWKKVKNELYR